MAPVAQGHGLTVAAWATARFDPSARRAALDACDLVGELLSDPRGALAEAAAQLPRVDVPSGPDRAPRAVEPTAQGAQEGGHDDE